MSSINIFLSKVDTNEIVVEIQPSISIRSYFSQTKFTASYEQDVSSVDDSILIIPALTNILPVSWATNSTIQVESIDRDFLYCLDDVHAGYQQLYPAVFDTPPKIDPQDVVSNSNDSTTTGMIFSGGVDSVATMLRKLELYPSLISIRRGSLDEHLWQMQQETVKNFAELNDLDTHFISSNITRVLDRRRLETEFSNDIERGWWTGVQFGIAYMGLCAPLTSLNGIKQLYQGSGNTQDPTFPQAGQPFIVDLLTWNSTECQIDAIDMTRQDKIELIARSPNIKDTPLDCCIDKVHGKINCCQCKKCLRTMLGLAISGVNPSQYGFPTNEHMLNEIQSQIESKELQFKLVDMWMELQKRIDKETFWYSDDEFVHWFKNYDLQKNETESEYSPQIKERIFNESPWPINELLYKSQLVAESIFRRS